MYTSSTHFSNYPYYEKRAYPTHSPFYSKELRLKSITKLNNSLIQKPSNVLNHSSLSFIPEYLFINRSGVRGKIPCYKQVLRNIPDEKKFVIKHSIRKRPANHYLLSVVLSDEKRYIPGYLNRTLRLLSYYQQHFPFKALVVSSSHVIQSLSKELQIQVISSVETNEYNLPLVKSLLLTLRDYFSSDYYGYLNSDILLSPDVFYILESLLTYQSSFTSSGYLVAARVHNSIDNKPFPQNMDELYKYIHTISHNKLRQPNSADIFFLPSFYDFNSIPDIVIGRWFIDNVMVQQTFLKNQFVIDISYSAKSIHQGYSGQTNLQKHIEKANFMYNGQFLDKKDKRIGLHVSPLVICPLTNDTSVY